MSTLLIRMTKPPYSTSSASDGLDFALSATNYGHDVVMVFEGEGILQLIDQQTPATTAIRNHAKRLKSLPLFDIHACYYITEDVPQWGLMPQALNAVAQPCCHNTLITLINSCDHVVTF
ncbi:DsrE family protein [Aestuariibacter sp. A3R04]|uniref:DsrE family protein n=1 Tax=Aestuariibacter sp. A3R04 TaxID=2841571 RepID=UPI001C085C33|nr:DsrE family protein [Aestuariibacter sp. A3R04]MBU3022827.1 DsrE family protein [Aestuariibacter sp. A3R04]